MTDDERDAIELGRIFDRLTPEGPDPLGRVVRMRSRIRRSRRRRTGSTVLAVAGVVAAVLIVARVGGSDTGTATSPAGQARNSLTCSFPGQDDRQRARTHSVTGGHIPAGAILARLCVSPPAPLLGPAQAVGRGAVPQDALTAGVGQLIHSFNTMARVPPNSCRGPAADTYTITFLYPDASVVRLTGSTGCDYAYVWPPGVDRSGTAVLSRFLKLLSQQRESQQPPTRSWSVPACPARSIAFAPPSGLLPPANQLGLVVARQCTYLPRATTTKVLSASEVRVINADYRKHLSRRMIEGLCPTDPPAVVVLGRTAWGDLVSMTSARGCGRDFARESDDAWLYYTPSAAGWAAINGD